MELILGPPEWLAIGLAITIILDVAALRALASRQPTACPPARRE